MSLQDARPKAAHLCCPPRSLCRMRARWEYPGAMAANDTLECHDDMRSRQYGIRPYPMGHGGAGFNRKVCFVSRCQECARTNTDGSGRLIRKNVLYKRDRGGFEQPFPDHVPSPALRAGALQPVEGRSAQRLKDVFPFYSPRHRPDVLRRHRITPG